MFVYVLNCFKINKATNKNNSWTHLQQKNKKAVLTTTAYCKVSTPARSQRQQYSRISKVIVDAFMKDGTDFYRCKYWRRIVLYSDIKEVALK